MKYFDSVEHYNRPMFSIIVYAYPGGYECYLHVLHA